MAAWGRVAADATSRARRPPRARPAPLTRAGGWASITASAIQHTGRPAHFFRAMSRSNAARTPGTVRGTEPHVAMAVTGVAHVADAVIEAGGCTSCARSTIGRGAAQMKKLTNLCIGMGLVLACTAGPVSALTQEEGNARDFNDLGPNILAGKILGGISTDSAD